MDQLTQLYQKFQHVRVQIDNDVPQPLWLIHPYHVNSTSTLLHQHFWPTPAELTAAVEEARSKRHAFHALNFMTRVPRTAKITVIAHDLTDLSWRSVAIDRDYSMLSVEWRIDVPSRHKSDKSCRLC